MMSGLMKLIVNGFGVWLAAAIVPGVSVTGLGTAIIVAVVFWLVNQFLRPVLVLLTLPLTILSLGIFLLILNIFLLFFVVRLVPGFEVDGLWAGIGFAIVLWMVNGVLSWMTREREGEDG